MLENPSELAEPVDRRTWMRWNQLSRSPLNATPELHNYNDANTLERVPALDPGITRVHQIMEFVGGRIGRLQKTTPSALSCCQNGVDLAKNESPGDSTRIEKTDSEQCSILSSGLDLFNELSAEKNAEAPSLEQCSLLTESCYLATKTNKFCHDAGLLAHAELPAGQFYEGKEINATIFFAAKSCCLAHGKLPNESSWSKNEMSPNASRIPACCFVSNYKDYMSPFVGPEEQLRSMSANITGSFKDHQMTTAESPHASNEEVAEGNIVKEEEKVGTLNGNKAGDKTATPSLTSNGKLIAASPTNTKELEENGDLNITPSSHQQGQPVKEEHPVAKKEVEIVCEEGFVWYPDKRLCIQMRSKCPRGMYMSARQNMCLPKDKLPFKCPPGYEYRDDIGDCEDVDECTEGVYQNNTFVDACPNTTQICRNTPGSFECVCKSGYSLSRDGECIDIDECKQNRTICRRGYKCRNILGSYQCIRQVPCGFGYILNPDTQECEDIDECKADPDICGPNMLCVNVRGGMRCMTKKCPGKQRRDSSGNCAPCPSGYEFNERLSSCDDINECALNSTLCRPFEKCTNRPGDYICEPKLRCENGLQINADGTSCEDIDECTTQAFRCQYHEICVNTNGSYYCAPSPCHSTEIFDYEKRECTCPHGYRHKNGECVDIDECAEEVAGVTNLNPLCKDGKTCVNTPGGYRCVTISGCPAGFKRNSIREPCTDIDECATGLAKCGLNMHCENTIGSYRCLCQRGYKNVNDTACVDIDECKVFSSVESCADPRARCVNTAGSYKCICPNGFVWHGYPVYACKDVNECVITPDICGHGHKCINEEGGYRCECAKGFRIGWDNRTCIDVDECSDSYPDRVCKDGICVNTPGGFRCDCPSGYRLSDQHQCVDINECQEKEDICESRYARGSTTFKCLNLHGDYRCISEHCPKMYRLEKLRNGFRCHLKPEHTCRPNDYGCLRDRPLLIESYNIELVAPMKPEQLLAEIDSSIVINGTVRAELRVHYAHQMRSNLHMSIEDAFKLRLKSPNSRFVDVVLMRPLQAPADLLISANLLAVRGRMRALKSVTKLYIFTTETAQQQAAFERQQRRNLRGRGY
ncbi:hypothetical protein AAHC03_09526 [Spirometra sp. Aus1]